MIVIIHYFSSVADKYCYTTLAMFGKEVNTGKAKELIIERLPH